MLESCGGSRHHSLLPCCAVPDPSVRKGDTDPSNNPLPSEKNALTASAVVGHHRLVPLRWARRGSLCPCPRALRIRRHGQEHAGRNQARERVKPPSLCHSSHFTAPATCSVRHTPADSLTASVCPHPRERNTESSPQSGGAPKTPTATHGSRVRLRAWEDNSLFLLCISQFHAIMPPTRATHT